MELSAVSPRVASLWAHFAGGGRLISKAATVSGVVSLRWKDQKGALQDLVMKPGG